ncbi:type I toxin-antitoxin system Fst family toxin (plasmid) [Staphylococcus equorum]
MCIFNSSYNSRVILTLFSYWLNKRDR